jgi:hypothetical protein
VWGLSGRDGVGAARNNWSSAYRRCVVAYLAHLKESVISMLSTCLTCYSLLFVPDHQLLAHISERPSLTSHRHPSLGSDQFCHQYCSILLCLDAHFDNNHPFSISIMFSASSVSSASSLSTPVAGLTKHVIRPRNLGEVTGPPTQSLIYLP